MNIYDYQQKIIDILNEAMNDSTLSVDEYVNLCYVIAGEVRDRLEIEGVKPYKR